MVFCHLFEEASGMKPNNIAIKNTLIVGSGAIGLLWFSHFHLFNHQTNTFLFQSSARKKIANQITFTDLNNQTHSIPSQIFEQSNINNDEDKAFDLILVCVKSYQLNQAINDIKPLISKDTIVITSHNGLGSLNLENNNFLRTKNVLNLLTTHGCLKSSTDHITHTGAGVSDLGMQFGILSNAHIKHITELLHSTFPDVFWHHSLLEKQWLKLAINCVINPITALFDIKNGDVLDARFTAIIDQLLDEIVQVAFLKGVTLQKQALVDTVTMVANKTANNSSSMRCDILENRATEVEYINGFIHRLGLEFGITTKKNTELYQRILARASE